MNSQKIIIFFSPVMGGIIFLLLFPDKCGSSSSVMAVSNIGEGHLFSKQLFNQQVCLRLFYNPEMVRKPIFCNKIIFRSFFAYYMGYDIINLFNGRICKKDGFNISIVHADMNHAILLFVSSSEFMLLNNTIYIVINRGAPNDSVLSPSFHRLGINIKMRFFILYQPVFFLPLSEIIY